MYGHDIDERDPLLIDRAAAAELPSEEAIREWARDKRVFISSVMAELPEERKSAAEGIRAVGGRPVMFEEFGGRDANPVDAYLDELETCQIYLGILGRRYGALLSTRFSATHTEFRHAESRGLRMAVWALRTQEREGPQQAFLGEARSYYVVPAFRSPAELRRQVADRLRTIAAEDLAPWSKLGSIVFRAKEVTHEGQEIAVTARVQGDDVAHALEGLAPDDFGRGEESRFTWAGRSRDVRVTNVRSTTTTARSKLVRLQLEIIEAQQDIFVDVGFGGLESDEVTEVILRAALLGESHRSATHKVDYLPEMADPLQPLREARVSDEIVRPLAELMVVDELVGSGRASRVTRFRLGASVGGLRRLELQWEPSRRYASERRPRRCELEGTVEL